MRGKISLSPNSPPVDADQIQVSAATEQWNEYTLDDGTRIRIKPVVTEVWRVVDAWDNEGNPLYVTKTAMVQVVNAPLDRKRQELQ